MMAENEKLQNENQIEEVEKDPQVTELDDDNLEDVSGGMERTVDGFEPIADTNNNCLC